MSLVSLATAEREALILCMGIAIDEMETQVKEGELEMLYDDPAERRLKLEERAELLDAAANLSRKLGVASGEDLAWESLAADVRKLARRAGRRRR